jgi:predicted dehydrogenase
MSLGTMRGYRVGIIGFGMIGKVHAYAYRTLPLCYDPAPLETRITHVVTSRAETAEKARRTLGADVAATDARAVTENPDIDIVHVCTPNHLHKDALLSAMRGQKHIYCEKPLVATMAEAEEVRAALPDYRGVAQMTFQNRFYSATMRAKQLLEAGALGEVLEFRASYLHGGNADPESPMRWRLSAAAGGGVIADLGSHVLDLVDWLIGPFRSVMAESRIAYPQRPAAAGAAQRVTVDAEDSVTALVRMQSGATGTIAATKLATGSEDELRIEIHGSRGAVRFNGMAPHWLEYYDAAVAAGPLGGSRGWTRIDCGQRYPPPATGFPSPKAALGWVRSHVACLASFLEAVAHNRPAVPGLDQGIRVQHWMDGLRRSAAQQRWIDV